MLELFALPGTWISLLTLTALELVLGVDNLLFISVITGRLPLHKQKRARQLGLIMACLMRILLLCAITWVTHFSNPLFTISGQTFSIREVVLIAGGLFLLAKATSEIHVDVTGGEDEADNPRYVHITPVIIQIMLLDIIFSLDSVITAVGMAQEFIVMVLAIMFAVMMMLFASEPMGRLIAKYPTLKMLALSFLLMVGVVLVADGFGLYIPRAYIYFAIAFSVFVEMLNIWAKNRRLARKIKLR